MANSRIISLQSIVPYMSSTLEEVMTKLTYEYPGDSISKHPNRGCSLERGGLRKGIVLLVARLKTLDLLVKYWGFGQLG
ncbi:hypothetical protein CsSME_00007538 [Camellia sinensis var. sinensis]